MLHTHARARSRRIVPVLVILVLALPLEAVRAQAVRAVGEVSAVVGEATVVRFRDTNEEPVDVGTELFEGDRLHTASDAKLRIALHDGSILQLGADTQLTLEWVLHAPDLDQQSVLLSMTTGILRSIVEALLPVSMFRLETTTAVTSVRGTDWIVEAAPEASAIVALEGEVAVGNVAEDVPGEVTLGPGEGTSVTPGEPPNPPSVWGDARRNDFIARTAISGP